MYTTERNKADNDIFIAREPDRNRTEENRRREQVGLSEEDPTCNTFSAPCMTLIVETTLT